MKIVLVGHTTVRVTVNFSSVYCQQQRKYSAEQRRAGLSVTPLPPPLTGLHLTLLKGGWVQAWCAHLPGAKRISAYCRHSQTRADARADA